MKLPKIAELRQMSALEKAHLQKLEDALQDILLAARLEAASDEIDHEKFSAAATVVALSVLARQLANDAIDQNAEVDVSALMDQAKEVLDWAADRKFDAFGKLVH